MEKLSDDILTDSMATYWACSTFTIEGETLYYTDTTAKPGVIYTYRVIPVHAELLNNGILLEGVQSVQVAQAKLPPQGFWGRIRNWLEDDDDEEDAVTSMSENQISMFWAD